jgi:hypothetical protein
MPVVCGCDALPSACPSHRREDSNSGYFRARVITIYFPHTIRANCMLADLTLFLSLLSGLAPQLDPPYVYASLPSLTIEICKFASCWRFSCYCGGSRLRNPAIQSRQPSCYNEPACALSIWNPLQYILDILDARCLDRLNLLNIQKQSLINFLPPVHSQRGDHIRVDMMTVLIRRFCIRMLNWAVFYITILTPKCTNAPAAIALPLRMGFT